MLHEIPFRKYTSQPSLLVEIPDNTPAEQRMRVAVETAVRQGNSLYGAKLNRSNLKGINLKGVDFGITNLYCANFAGSNLDGSNFKHANLEGANFSGASLMGANLMSGYFYGANLTGTNLTGSNLEDADFEGSNLNGCILSPPDDQCWAAIRNDLTRVLHEARSEVAGVLAALREGRVDGTVYVGECACLIGTIANIRGVRALSLKFNDSDSPIERFFLAISKGHTPETNPISKIVEEWIVAWMKDNP